MKTLLPCENIARITAFIGAGACIDIDEDSSTECITRKVRTVSQEIFDPTTKRNITRPFIDDVACRLKTFWGTEPNFEDIFHTLEMLDSCGVGWYQNAAKKFRPALSGFVTAIDAGFFNETFLRDAQEKLINAVADQIDVYDWDFDPNGKYSWYSGFWRKATKKLPWDIATTNYDMCIEKSLYGYTEYRDGFGNPNSGIYSFYPSNMLKSKKTKVMHLHGSIYYGYPTGSDEDISINGYDRDDLVKFDSTVAARKTWRYGLGGVRDYSQAGEKTIAGPIIIGLRKTDKLLTYPYNTYSSCFANSIVENPRLLIAGYSFGDLHFNAWLEKIVNIHRERSRIVIISKFDAQEIWQVDPNLMIKWLPHAISQFIVKTCRSNPPFKRNVYESPLISNDERVRLYCHGLRDAFENHGDEIIEFLSA